MQEQRFQETLTAARLPAPDTLVNIAGDDPVLATAFPVGEAAATALALCGTAAAELWRIKTDRSQSVAVDVRGAAASLNGFLMQRLDGNVTPRTAAGNPFVALYECADGRWIHLHGAMPKLHAGTVAVLGCAKDADRDAVAAAVVSWDSQKLEDALAVAGTCGAVVRTSDEWAAHPQGIALADHAAVEIEKVGDAPPQPLRDGDQPLSGIRALDLTRILAGPTCGRTLAQHGADVMLVNSPEQPNIPPFVLDTSHGKLSAYVDLEQPDGAGTLRGLVEGADVFTQGYRTGALSKRGFGLEDVVKMRPGIIYVSINCYGHTGPWESRPGWEQLAQSTTGVAASHSSVTKPALIPAAACDYTTGYLAAYGVMTALARRAVEGGSWHVKASLCQTGMWFNRLRATLDASKATGIGDISRWMTQSQTAAGSLTHLAPIVDMSETNPRWVRPSPALGADAPAWP